MLNIENEIQMFRREAEIDFVGLWHVAANIEDEIASSDQREIRFETLRVVKGFMALGMLPGDYSFAETSFRFWTGSPEEHLDRIETEWIEMGLTPNLGDPICWFSLRPIDIAGEPVWIMGEWTVLKAI